MTTRTSWRTSVCPNGESGDLRCHALNGRNYEAKIIEQLKNDPSADISLY